MNKFKFHTALVAASLLVCGTSFSTAEQPTPEDVAAMSHEKLVEYATDMARKSLATKARKERAATKKDAKEDEAVLTVKSAAKIATTLAIAIAWFHVGQYYAKETYNKAADAEGNGKSHLGDTIAKLGESLAIKLFILDPLCDELKKFKKVGENSMSAAWDYAASFAA